MNAQTSEPIYTTERVPLLEVPNSDISTHAYWLSLPEKYRHRHFVFAVDRSVCKGDLRVNDQNLNGEDASDIFRFDKNNDILIKGCLERTPEPLQLFAYPKVFIARARLYVSGQTQVLEYTVRNTLANSVSVSIQMRNFSASLFLGPETSQSRTLSLPVPQKISLPATLDLYKHPEAIEGGYHHTMVLLAPGNDSPPARL